MLMGISDMFKCLITDIPQRAKERGLAANVNMPASKTVPGKEK